jgi:hypothetical protein
MGWKRGEKKMRRHGEGGDRKWEKNMKKKKMKILNKSTERRRNETKY